MLAHERRGRHALQRRPTRARVSDACETGVCTGSDRVVCEALDQCHDAGTCDAAAASARRPARPTAPRVTTATPAVTATAVAPGCSTRAPTRRGQRTLDRAQPAASMFPGPSTACGSCHRRPAWTRSTAPIARLTNTGGVTQDGPLGPLSRLDRSGARAQVLWVRPAACSAGSGPFATRSGPRAHSCRTRRDSSPRSRQDQWQRLADRLAPPATTSSGHHSERHTPAVGFHSKLHATKSPRSDFESTSVVWIIEANLGSGIAPDRSHRLSHPGAVPDRHTRELQRPRRGADGGSTGSTDAGRNGRSAGTRAVGRRPQDYAIPSAASDPRAIASEPTRLWPTMRAANKLGVA